MAVMPNKDPLPPATAHMLHALEAFLDAPPVPCAFRCFFCRDLITIVAHFIMDLSPFSTTRLLFDYVTAVNFREEDYPLRNAYVGEAPAGSLVDVVSIYCASCGSWLGWTIIRQYTYHPIIREGQFVLACGGGGGGGGGGVGIMAEYPM